ncbi:WD40-repeat-containing domain protein, partial [Mycena pura]
MQTLLHADSLKQSELLKTLSPVDLDASQRSPCLEQTREDILEKIISWLTVPPTNSNILWFSGVAGSGKSTIAASIAKHFRELDSLGAFVFFSRNKENSPRAVLHGIANSLAMLNLEFKATLCHTLEQNFSIVNADINTQFQKLLLDPLNAILANCNIIVILDALDECSDDEWRRTLVSLIANDFSRLPRNIRFFITSRRNRDISAPFGSKSHITELSLDISDDQTKADILLYLDHRFKGIRAEQNIQNDRWPESHTMESLAKYAGGLFIWAATACSLIRDAYDPDDMLMNLLAKDSDVANNLDGLYTVALGTSGKWNDGHFVRKAPAVLAVVILARVPLTDKSMDLLLGYQDGESAKILSQLGCVIQWAPNQPTRSLHASFADYLTDPKHIGTQPWFVDSALGHRYLALGCLEVLRKQLKFNICGLESSYVLNSELEDLNTRIQQFISPELSYASQFWTTHLDNVEVAEDTDPLLVAVNNCFPGHFLYWLEVLSLLGHVNIAHANLDIPVRMLHGKNVNLGSFFLSAQDFLDRFGPVIAQSVPHIYLSATVCIWVAITGEAVSPPLKGHSDTINSVVFSPDGKHIASGSYDCTVHIWDVMTHKSVGGPLCGHTSSVQSVTFSPDGRHIVSGSGDKTVRIWDAATGEAVGTPLKGHTGGIYSVVFSPDMKHIVSGSLDRTIRIWDIASGQTVAAPLEGHTNWVRSVAFSPDGMYIISGSDDHTVRIWDAITHEAVGTPLKGHTKWVRSVAFSPNGKYVVSGSDDRTIRIWDAMSGEVVVTSLKEQSIRVNSVVFSPDGKQIASGSDDDTVCIWDVVTGKTVCAPLKGHTSSVLSVVFSPDGKYIASGSKDKTVCIWDAITGEAVDPPLKGHSGTIHSVVFSPDGKHIASGSSDGTVHVWDMTTHKSVGAPLKGHTSSIQSVIFSPDGRHIASGSRDKTVRIWDAATGEAAGTPLRGHTSSIRCVAFSPDGKHIVSGSTDRTIRIWDMASGQAVGAPLQGHTEWVRSVAFSPDGMYITSGSEDHTVRIWD